MGRAIWRDLVIGFAAQLGELNLGFTQLAALYALADITLQTDETRLGLTVDHLVRRLTPLLR